MLSNQLIALRSSDAVDVMFANPMTGVVEILFMTGHAYKFKNVSRRAIVNLILNPNMSLGFWVNENLNRSQRVEYKLEGKINPELRKLSCCALERSLVSA
jgi:glycerol uptake facilitator-like aquaporin